MLISTKIWWKVQKGNTMKIWSQSFTKTLEKFGKLSGRLCPSQKRIAWNFQTFSSSLLQLPSHLNLRNPHQQKALSHLLEQLGCHPVPLALHHVLNNLLKQLVPHLAPLRLPLALHHLLEQLNRHPLSLERKKVVANRKSLTDRPSQMASTLTTAQLVLISHQRLTKRGHTCQICHTHSAISPAQTLTSRSKKSILPLYQFS